MPAIVGRGSFGGRRILLRGCADEAQPWPERPAAKQHEREALTTVAVTT
jgi:hypothetical protein